MLMTMAPATQLIVIHQWGLSRQEILSRTVGYKNCSMIATFKAAFQIGEQSIGCVEVTRHVRNKDIIEFVCESCVRGDSACFLRIKLDVRAKKEYRSRSARF